MVLEWLYKRKIRKKETFIKDYKILRLIGEGRFGRCYLVELNNEKYILKEIKKKFIKKDFEKTDQKELPWYKELNLCEKELTFLKRLIGLEKEYGNIYEVEKEFVNIMKG